MEQEQSTAGVLEVTGSQSCLGEKVCENVLLSLHKYGQMRRPLVKVFQIELWKWMRCMCSIVRQDSLKRYAGKCSATK